MMLANIGQMDPYERQLLLVFRQAAENSPWLNETKKRVIERKLQEIVDAYRSKDFVL